MENCKKNKIVGPPKKNQKKEIIFETNLNYIRMDIMIGFPSAAWKNIMYSPSCD